MELLVLDTEFKSSATLDIFESLIWTDRYFECGDFEIYTPAESEIMKMLPKGYYLYLKESEHIMIIEDVEIETDVEQGAHLKITGRSLESILDRRIIWGQAILSGSLQDGIKKLLNENVIFPSDENRKIPNFSFEESTDVRIKAIILEAQYYGDNLYDTIVDICKNAGVGFKIVLNGTNLVFSLYMGTDRSYSQTENPYVVFSPGFDNLINSNYIESTRTLKNVTLVAGEGEGSGRKTTTVYLGSSAASGLDRRELFTDASGISQTVEDGTLTYAEYISQLAQKGNEELSNNTETVSFEGEVDISATYTYDEDYFLGDVVQVGNEFGNEARCRITEFVRSQDETGNEYYPTFETLGGGTSISLPSGYERINYIRMSGTQYINSINLDANFQIIFDVMLDNTTVYYNLYDSSYRALWITSAGELEINATTPKAPISKNERLLVISDATGSSNVARINSSQVLSVPKAFISGQVTMFNRAGGECFKGAVYGIKVYSGSNLTYNFIPCVNPSGEYGLYDVVNNQFYGNAGTGSFTGG